ncbi:hypothetical protein JCM16303_004809 [Sporobolomyces ruberrimus]
MAESLPAELENGVPASNTTTSGGATGESNQLAEQINNDEMQDEELEEEEEQDEEIYESSSSPSTETDTLTWINWFCSLPGHEYFCDVAEDFIEDDFNLTGLASLVPFYKEAMEMVLDVEPEEDETHRVPDVSIVESSAELLYGLIHQRYIITRQGLQQMYAKFEANHFGTCPRVYCSQTKLVPCGRSDLPGVDTVKLFCSSCLDMYVPPSSRFQGVDGAFFGTTFPHLLFQTFPPPSALPTPSPDPHSIAEGGDRVHTAPTTSLSKVYIPRIYGFKVSEKARSGPRMQWMRMRPRTEGELDWEENAVRPTLPHGSAGPGGSGEKGDLFDEDLDEEDDDEEEEEEEAATGQQGGAAAGGAAQEGDRLVGDITSQLNDKLSTTGSKQTLVDLTQLPRRTDRAIKPLPSSSRQTSASPPQKQTFAAAVLPSPPPPLSSFAPSYPDIKPSFSKVASEESTRASFALAASIQKHLALANGSKEFDFDLPKPPRPVAHKLEKHGLQQRVGTAV